MPDVETKYNSQLEKDSHDNSANIVGKRVILYGWNPNTLAYERLSSTNGLLTFSGATSDETSSIYNGATAISPVFVPISASSNGDNTIVAAITNKRIRVVSGLVMAAGTVNISFKDNAGGTAITGTLPLIANTGFVIPYVPVGNFQTSSGNALVLNLSGAIAVSGWLTYIAF